MAIQVDDYGRPVQAAATNGVPKNFSATNNGSNWQGPSYDAATGQYDWDPGYIRDAVNGTERQAYGQHADGSPGGGGGAPGGGGLPLWAKLAAAIAPAAAGRALSGGGSNQTSPELQALLAMALKRMAAQEGLFQSINAQALGGLPTIYQRQG